MDYLAARSAIDPSSRRDLLTNRLVLIAPADSPIKLSIGEDFPLAAALGSGRLSVGDPDSVPAGRYARAALTSLKVWTSVENRLVRADNVRSALRFVALGEAPLGIVYATDARREPRVRVVDVFAEPTHPPIRYPLALTPHASPAARQFREYLLGDEARLVFIRYGFGARP
jgi:molybdate transport system substrate-binding protein